MQKTVLVEENSSYQNDWMKKSDIFFPHFSGCPSARRSLSDSSVERTVPFGSITGSFGSIELFPWANQKVLI
jgi:hypothetical protein